MGFKIVEILEPIMTHSIGNPKPIRLLWLKGRTSNHRPWRWYYMVRNNVVLVREYFWRDPMWALLATLSCIQGFALALLFEKARLLKVKYAMLGFCDGLAGRFDRAIN